MTGRLPVASRKRAMAKAKKTYNGAPCPYGHGTKRYVCNYSCVVCARNKDRRTRTLSIGETRALRQAARERGDLFFTGNPCIHGHNGTRYVSTGKCVNCCERDRRAHEARAAASAGLPKIRPKKPQPVENTPPPEPPRMGWDAAWGRFTDDPRVPPREPRYIPRHPLVDAA